LLPPGCASSRPSCAWRSLYLDVWIHYMYIWFLVGPSSMWLYHNIPLFGYLVPTQCWIVLHIVRGAHLSIIVYGLF
jgi:hypothetical protein